MASSSRQRNLNVPYEMEFDAAGESEIHVTLVRSIAAARNDDPCALDFNLSDYVAPEALDALYAHAEAATAAEWEFEFAVEELDVTLDSGGTIRIE